MPFFSIIIPCYNRASLIERPLKSLSNQTFQDFEIIIIDDGSTDNSKEIIAPYLINSQVNYYYQDNAGVCSARNFGAQKAKGDYLIFLDSDDAVEKNWLNDFYLLKEEHFDMLFCSVQFVNHKGNITIIDCSQPSEKSKSKGVYYPGSWAMKSSVFFDIDMYDEKLKYSENTDLKIKLIEKGFSMGFVKNPNFIYYQNLSGGSKNELNKIQSNEYLIEKHKLFFINRPYVLQTFLQLIAISCFKLKQYKKARKIIIKAWKVNPKNVKIFINLLLIHFSFITKKRWK
jgi:glycosyltransferase involved in cell wall biosynthesis